MALMRRACLLLLSALVWGACSRAPNPAAQPVSDTPTVAFEKSSLPNGLEVILSEDHRLPMVAVNLWYHVGPANEEAGPNGIRAPVRAHDVPGLEARPGPDALPAARRRGGQRLSTAPRTSIAPTTYETLPSNQLELALWLESDRMGYLLDTLDQANLTNQQDVVRNERRESVENAPYGIVDEEEYHQLFPTAHPYHADVIGTHADIQAAKLEDDQDASSRCTTRRTMRA